MTPPAAIPTAMAVAPCLHPAAGTGCTWAITPTPAFEYAEIRYGGAVFFNGDSTAPHYGNLRKDGAGTLTLDHTW